MKISDIPSFCLILDKRYGRWIEVYQPRLKEVGIDPYQFIAGDGDTVLKYDFYDDKELPPYYGRYSIDYPTWYKRPNAYNAWKCHKKMMEMALSINHDIVLLLEDDAFPESDFQQILDDSAEFLESNSWDMLYLGHYSNHHLQDIGHKYVHRTYGSGGFHGVIIKKPVLEALIGFYPIGPYDWISGKYIHSKFNCFAITPCILSQDSGYSYVEDSKLIKPDRNMK
jgi:hypothetical protein